MKQTIKGITYNTEKDPCLAQKTDYFGVSWALRRTRHGHFYIHEARDYVAGKPKPFGVELTEFNPAAVLPGDPPRLSDLYECRDFIRPITPKAALAWCIRTQIHRTFHKDLARFLE